MSAQNAVPESARHDADAVLDLARRFPGAARLVPYLEEFAGALADADTNAEADMLMRDSLQHSFELGGGLSALSRSLPHVMRPDIVKAAMQHKLGMHHGMRLARLSLAVSALDLDEITNEHFARARDVAAGRSVLR